MAAPILHVPVLPPEGFGPLPVPPRPFLNLDATRAGARIALTVHECTGSDLWVADLALARFVKDVLLNL